MIYDKAKEYPNAWEIFRKHRVYKEHDYYGYIVTYMRDLYDFFDDQEVYVSVSNSTFCGDMITGAKVGIEWGYLISTKEFCTKNYDSYFESREDTEYAAFVRAFEILEEQLENRV